MTASAFRYIRMAISTNTSRESECYEMFKDRIDFLSGIESTNSLGANPSEGSVTPRIHPLINAHSCILDGELLAWNCLVDSFCEFCL